MEKNRVILWSDDMDVVYGLCRDFKNEKDFINHVCNEYIVEMKVSVTVFDVKKELCVVTEQGIKSDTVIPVNLTDITLEDFYTARVKPIDKITKKQEVAIKPTIGRIVYYKGASSVIYPAIIQKVLNYSCVDLVIFFDDGFSNITGVLRGDGVGQWDWMPYQKEQAAKQVAEEGWMDK